MKGVGRETDREERENAAREGREGMHANNRAAAASARQYARLVHTDSSIGKKRQ